MEPNTSIISPAAAGSSAPAAVAPAPGNNGSALSVVDAPPATPSSEYLLPSSSFPTAAAGTLPMVGYDLFGDPEEAMMMAAAASPLPPPTTLLGGAQWEQGESSSLLVPECPTSPAGSFGFAGGESVAWPMEDMPSSFFSPLSDSDQLAPLLLPVVEEGEEESDVSAFLVSDLEDQLPPNASWTATATSLQMGSGGGGACASWMAPGSTGSNNWPALAAEAASTCTMGAAGSSSSNFNGFVPNLQGPLLPVKQEVMEFANATAARRQPDFISLVDDDEDGLYQDAFFGSSSPSIAAPGSWGSSPSFAPGNGSWGGSSSRRSPSFAGKMPCFDQSSSMTKKLSIGGKTTMPFTSGLPPLPRLCASTRNGGAGIAFTDPEMAIIAKDKKLQQLSRTDPKKVKRILYNRAYSAMTKVRKVMHTKNLERMIVALEEKRKSLSEELRSLEEGSAALRAQQMKMQRIIGELEQQTMLKDAVREVLRADIQKLNHLKLN